MLDLVIEGKCEGMMGESLYSERQREREGKRESKLCMDRDVLGRETDTPLVDSAGRQSED